MKKIIFAFVAFFATTFSANAMNFEQAREQALFLTDKMAYELNLTDDQYEAAYEVNLDYLLGINSEADLYGVYWTNRNLDMSYILAEWQYRAYCDALYFYRPLYWGSGYWHFRIFARYPHRSFFYFGRPAFYHTYRGGHSWNHHPGSYYRDRHFGGAHRPGGDGRGMRDGYHGTNNHGGFSKHGQAGRPGNNGGINRPNSSNHMNRPSDGGNMNRPNNSNGISRQNGIGGANRSINGNGMGHSFNSNSNANRPSSEGMRSGSMNNSNRSNGINTYQGSRMPQGSVNRN